MNVDRLDPVFLPNGVARNPLGKKNDDPHQEQCNAILDLVACIRGATPNRRLGEADHFIGVGEWGLALDQIEYALTDDFPLQNTWIKAAFERANAAIPKNEEGYRD